MHSSKDTGSSGEGYFPLNLQLRGRPCLVVGGGKVALRKVRNLLEFGGSVTVVAPDFCAALEELGKQDRVALIRRAYEQGEAAQYRLVIAAVDDAAVNQRVFEDCRAASVLINVVDDPERCDFILSGTVRRGPLVVSIGTQGAAPFFARWVREQLDEMLPAHWEEVALLAEEFRKRVLDIGGLGFEEKKAIFRRSTAVDWKTLLEEKGAAEATMDRLLNEDAIDGDTP